MRDLPCEVEHDGLKEQVSLVGVAPIRIVTLSEIASSDGAKLDAGADVRASRGDRRVRVLRLEAFERCLPVGSRNGFAPSFSVMRGAGITQQVSGR